MFVSPCELCKLMHDLPHTVSGTKSEHFRHAMLPQRRQWWRLSDSPKRSKQNGQNFVEESSFHGTTVFSKAKKKKGKTEGAERSGNKKKTIQVTKVDKILLLRTGPALWSLRTYFKREDFWIFFWKLYKSQLRKPLARPIWFFLKGKGTKTFIPW